MRSLRTLLRALSPAIILAPVICSVLSGQGALTTIQDTLFDADGARYNGSLTIQWGTFTSGSGQIVQHSSTVQVVNGNLLVQLAPNNTATPPANIYTVQYQTDGSSQYTETWSVPVSTTPLKVSQVRVGSGSSGGSAGGLSGGGSGPFPESSVTNLVSDLNARPIKGPAYGTNAVAVIDQNGQIETAVGNLGDCVFVDGTTGPCSNAVVPNFFDAEVPGGTIDGLNATFTLANSPDGASLELFRNGVLQTAGVDYTLTGSTIQFAGPSTPQVQDKLVASYRSGGGSGSGGGSAGPSGAPGVNGCGAAGVSAKSLLYQIQSIDNGSLLVQSSNAGFLLPVTVPPAGWCVVLLDTNSAGISVSNNGNPVNGIAAPYALAAGSEATVISDGSGYWISGAGAGPLSAIDHVFRTFDLPALNACTPTAVAGTHVQSAVCTFAAGSQQYAFGHFPIPANAPRVLYLEIKWRTSDTTTSHNATFDWFYGSSSVTLDPTLVHGGTVTAAAVTAANQMQTSMIALSSPVTYPGDEFYFYISRRGDTDSVSSGVDLISARIHD